MSVDPYVVRIPQSVINGNDQELIAWYQYDNRWKHDLWRSLGGGSSSVDESLGVATSAQDQVDILLSQLSFSLQRIEELEAQLNDYLLPPQEWLQANVTGAYTAADGQELNATLSAIIAFPTSGRVKVNNLDGSLITVNLSGSQTIFGESSVIIQSKGSIVFKYLSDSDQWVFE